MPRNNGWLAVLAISVVLPILRHGLAGERLPLDYGNAELRTNRSKSAYTSHGSNHAAHNLQNALSYQQSSRTNVKSVQTLPMIRNTGNAVSSERTRSVSPPASSKITDVFFERSSTKESKLRPQNLQERVDKFAPTTKMLDKNRESRNLRSSQVSGGAIKVRLERTKEEPVGRGVQMARSGTPGGNHLVGFGYPYYGHVDGNTRDDDPLKTSERSWETANSSGDEFLREKLDTEEGADGSSRGPSGYSDANGVLLLTDHRPYNELANKTVIFNKRLKETRTGNQDLITQLLKWKSKRDNRSVYSLMNKRDSVHGSIKISGPNESDKLYEVSRESENTVGTEQPRISFDLKFSNQTKRDNDSSNFDGFQLTSNKSTDTESPLGDETLLKRGSPANKNARRDNDSIFFMDSEFPSEFTKSNTREYPSLARKKSLISTLYPNSSNQNRLNSNQKKIREKSANETSDYEENDMIELDFDEENITNDSISDVLDSNYDESRTTSFVSDAEDESNSQVGNETDTIWSQLNEHDNEDELKSSLEVGFVFEDTTKEAKTVFVVSPVELLERNATRPSAKRNFSEENDHLAQNSSEASSPPEQRYKFPKSLNTNVHSQEDAVNVETSNGSTLTRPSSLLTEEIVGDTENSEERSAAKFNRSLNGSIIVSKAESGDLGIDGTPRLSSDQNSVYKIKDNEPALAPRWKNVGNKAAEDGSGDNGRLNQVNPTRKEGKGIKRPRSMDPGISSWIKQRFQKDKRSRSSKVANATSMILKFNSSKLKEETAPMSSNEDARNKTNDPKIDSAKPMLESGLQTPIVTLDHPQLVLNLRDRSFVSKENLTLTTNDPGVTSVGETATFSTTEFETMSVDIHPSIIASTDDEQRSFGSGMNSLELNGEERMDVEDGSYKTNNSSVELEPLDQWPVKHSAVVEGDLVLGGLMMVHEREDTITCGPVMPQGGVQALEAMLYTLDRLNEQEIVPGVKIGAHILDDCDKDTYGLEMAVDFIKGSISNIDGAEYHCNKTAVRKVISGVVGAASSVTSIQVANLLRLFRIPQVSFFSTSPELSNKQRFEYFTRTIPSDHYQVKAMVDIVLKMGWSYVSIIYEESNYGIKAFEELEELLGKHNICIANKEKLVKDSGVAEETAYDNIVLKLLTKPRARGCIIFGSDQEVAGVMRAVRRRNATDMFSWIGSDGWSARGLVSNGNEPEVEGTLSVQPQANPVKGFEEYFLNLTVENNRRNPWFVEFWEDHFQCRYPNASKTPYNQKYTKPCTTKERLTKQNTAFEDQLQFVSDAVMAFAYAFRDMHRDLCYGKPGLCDSMKPTRGTELLKYLRKVDFEGLSGDKFKFDKNGDGPARYNIIHFKQTEPGKYKWIRVGKYLEGELRLNMSEIQFKLGHPQPPESVCSLPCEVGQAKKYVEGERCCWHCFNCTQYQIRHPKDETQCIPCRQGTVPDETHSTCRDIPEEFLRPESGWAIGAMSFSATGIMITLFVGGVFLKHNDTPVVRASGRELSYVLLSGILLCYLVTFALVLRPTDIVCGIQRFTAGFCFTVVYAALLTKTNRISRIFNASKHSAKRPSFISPRSQLIICSGLMFVQILINGVWMIIDPARAMHHYPTREDNLLVCNSYVDASYMIAFAYPIMLIVVCTVYAVLTRKIPEAFNESKHIGFTMYTTCVIWLAFVPLYFGTGNNVALRITSMSVTISLSASVTIACLFSPKLYIILIRPERNVRQSMMPARYSTTKSSAVTATNASSMIAPITLTAATCDQNKAVKKHIITTIDCSTQSEYYELELKDRKNGKPSPTVVSRSTQTSGNEMDSNAIVPSKDSNENTATTKQLNNNARIGNGPVNQSDVPL